MYYALRSIWTVLERAGHPVQGSYKINIHHKGKVPEVLVALSACVPIEWVLTMSQRLGCYLQAIGGAEHAFVTGETAQSEGYDNSFHSPGSLAFSTLCSEG